GCPSHLSVLRRHGSTTLSAEVALPQPYCWKLRAMSGDFVCPTTGPARRRLIPTERKQVHRLPPHHEKRRRHSLLDTFRHSRQTAAGSGCRQSPNRRRRIGTSRL